MNSYEWLAVFRQPRSQCFPLENDYVFPYTNQFFPWENYHKASWKRVNEVPGRKKARTAKLKGKNEKERLGSWYYHFSNLLGGELSADRKDENAKQIFQSLPIDDTPFTMDEYKTAKKNIKTGKAAGPAGIPPEVLKYCDLKETVLQYANKLLMTLDRPNQWSESNLVPIPKDINLSQVSNHRGISLSQIMLEVVNRMILGTLSIDK